MTLETIFNTECYTLAHALIWFALGIMGGYGLFKPEKKRRKRKDV